LPAHSGVESRGEANGVFANLAKSNAVWVASRDFGEQLKPVLA
jgi:hypothetical protein